MSDLHMALRHHEQLRHRLLVEFPELAVDEETLADTLEGASDLDQAIAAVVRSMETDEALADGCEARIIELGERRERFQHRIAVKRRLIAETMEAARMRKLTLPEATLSLGTSPAKVVIVDEAALPADYFVQPDPPPPRADKRLILQALKDGTVVPGACLSNQSPQLTIRRK